LEAKRPDTHVFRPRAPRAIIQRFFDPAQARGAASSHLIPEPRGADRVDIHSIW
jgi:hypothetical protein